MIWTRDTRLRQSAGHLWYGLVVYLQWVCPRMFLIKLSSEQCAQQQGFDQGCQIYFFKKGQTFSKKRPKTANKIAEKKHSTKKGRKRANKAKFIKICLLTTQIHIKTHLVYSQRLRKKAINSKLFLEFVTYDRKMQVFFFFTTPK